MMKASTVLKTLIVITVVAVIGYIIYNNNKAAEITELVSKPTEQYDFASHVDSVCDIIKNASCLQGAKPIFDQLYEEMDVYANIKLDNATYLIPLSKQEELFTKAFECYYPKIEKGADNVFGRENWSPNQNKSVKEEINQLINRRGEGTKRGMSQVQKDKLKKYRSYYDGYVNFSNLLAALERCDNANTYKRYSALSNYKHYPYDNLTKMQSRSENARANAQNNWRSILEQQGNELRFRKVDYTESAVQAYSDATDAWRDRVESYEEATYDDSYFESLKYQVTKAYEDVSYNWYRYRNN